MNVKVFRMQIQIQKIQAPSPLYAVSKKIEFLFNGVKILLTVHNYFSLFEQHHSWSEKNFLLPNSCLYGFRITRIPSY